MSDGTTIGIWVGEDDEIVDEFDTTLGMRPDYSRSEKIKDAMAMYVTIAETLDDIEYDFDGEPPKRHFVRQAIFNQARQESNNPAD